MFRRTRHVHLDANATTPVSDRVRRVMNDTLARRPGNASSLHRAGREAALVLQSAREKVATAINASPDEIVFNSGASEGNNTVLRALSSMALAGTLPALAREGGTGVPSRNRLLTSPAEHSSVRAVAEFLATQGVEVGWLALDAQGRVDPGALAAQLDERVFLVSVMLANNELGTINPVRDLAALAHAVGAYFHADCVQALGKTPVDVQALGIDFATFSAHKLYGPKGAGVLYVRDGAPAPVLALGGHQEHGLRAGTEATHDIAGCGEAFAGVAGLLSLAPAIARRRDALHEGLRSLAPDLVANSPPEGVVCNTLNLRFPGVPNADLLGYLDAHGIAVSAGSACLAQGNAASHVLKAIGLDDTAAQESLRFSLGSDVDDEDIRYVVQRIGEYLRGEAPPVALVSPGAVDAAFLADERNWVLDVRLGIERRFMDSMPGAHEIPFAGFARHLDAVPRDRSVLVVCSSGVDASIVARALKARGHPRVGVLVGGLLAWRALQGMPIRRRRE